MRVDVQIILLRFFIDYRGEVFMEGPLAVPSCKNQYPLDSSSNSPTLKLHVMFTINF
jgi:hypothetical protein